MDSTPRFLADITVRRLARWLRYAGWDVADGAEEPLPRLLHRARLESRVLITRSARGAFEGFMVKAERLDDQLRAIRAAYPHAATPLIRCGACNARLIRCERTGLEGRVPAYVLAHHRRFSRCPICGRVYWLGTHVRHILRKLEQCGFRWERRLGRRGRPDDEASA